MTEKKGMVFGTFDGLHDGHRHFLAEASTLGSLIIVVAPDEHVLVLKGHAPKHSLEKRIAELQKEYPRSTVIPGDSVLETWNVITTHLPDVIALGYDQKELMRSLLKKLSSLPHRPEIRIIGALRPNELKSSKLNAR